MEAWVPTLGNSLMVWKLSWLNWVRLGACNQDHNNKLEIGILGTLTTWYEYLAVPVIGRMDEPTYITTAPELKTAVGRPSLQNAHIFANT